MSELPSKCERCGAAIDTSKSRGIPTRYCSGACRQAAYRERLAEEIELADASESPIRRLVHVHWNWKDTT